MTPPREIELKLDVTEPALALLTRSPLLRNADAQRAVSLVSVYYDTDTHKLRKRGLTLRLRRIGRRYVQTVKRESNGTSTLMDRGESEHPVAGGRPDLTLIQDSGFKAILTKKLAAQLKPLFETRVRRKVYPIRVDGSEIELTIDKGTVAAGRLSSPICEVELELKSGNPADLFKLARALAEHIPVQLALTSKSERGYALINRAKPRSVGASAISVTPDATCQTALQIIARSCLRQLVANQALARDGDSQGVHQARVGLRRLRVAISLFGGILLDPQSQKVKDELRWIARELGPARELDVFIDRVITPAVADKPERPGDATLARDVRRKRREALDGAKSAIESERFRMLVLDVAAWIEAGDWTRNTEDLIRAMRDQPIGPVAAAEMEHRFRTILKRGARLAELDPPRRHKVRIQAKKLRYGCEFFRDTFPDKKAIRRREKLVAALETLQDALGDLNDISAHEGLAEQLAYTPLSGKPGAADRAFAAGRLSGREEARVASVLKKAERAYVSFAKTRPFWRL